MIPSSCSIGNSIGNSLYDIYMKYDSYKSYKLIYQLKGYDASSIITSLSHVFDIYASNNTTMNSNQNNIDNIMAQGSCQVSVSNRWRVHRNQHA